MMPPSAHDGMGEPYSPQYTDADFAMRYYQTIRGRGPQRCVPPGTWCYSFSPQQHGWRSATKISLIFFIFRKKLFFSPLTRWLTLFLELASWLLALAYHSHLICILNNVVGAIGWYTAVGQPIKEMWADLLFTLLWGPSAQYDDLAGYFQPAHLWTSREKVQCPGKERFWEQSVQVFVLAAGWSLSGSEGVVFCAGVLYCVSKWSKEVKKLSNVMSLSQVCGRVAGVTEVSRYFLTLLLFCFPDTTGQVGSGYY